VRFRRNRRQPFRRVDDASMFLRCTEALQSDVGFSYIGVVVLKTAHDFLKVLSYVIESEIVSHLRLARFVGRSQTGSNFFNMQREILLQAVPGGNSEWNTMDLSRLEFGGILTDVKFMLTTRWAVRLGPQTKLVNGAAMKRERVFLLALTC
jgi:hypothetical protein